MLDSMIKDVRSSAAAPATCDFEIAYYGSLVRATTMEKTMEFLALLKFGDLRQASPGHAILVGHLEPVSCLRTGHGLWSHV